jgi:hypothetical protein
MQNPGDSTSATAHVFVESIFRACTSQVHVGVPAGGGNCAAGVHVLVLVAVDPVVDEE